MGGLSYFIGLMGGGGFYYNIGFIVGGGFGIFLIYGGGGIFYGISGGLVVYSNGCVFIDIGSGEFCYWVELFLYVCK